MIWSRRPLHWKLVKRVAILAFVLLVLVILAMQAQKYDWQEVGSAIRAYSPDTLFFAAGFVALTYTIYSGFDVLGRSYAGVAVRAQDAMAVAFISYAVNQNCGALIGTVGLRLRLYSSLGIGVENISKIVMLSVATNWLGYAALAGVLLLLRLVVLPAAWEASMLMLQLIGVLLLCGVLLYLWLCGRDQRRHLTLFRTRFEFPSQQLAIGQLLLSITHWPATAGIIYVLLHGEVDFLSILGTFMLASVAMVVAHLPAGIGVLEGMFILLLGEQVPHTQLLAALLVFRAMFHVGALGVAGLIFVVFEAGSQSGNSPVQQSGKF